MKAKIGLRFTCGLISMLCLGCGVQPDVTESAPGADEVTASSGAPNQNIGTSEQGLCWGGRAICQGWDGSYRQRCLANCGAYSFWVDTGAAVYYSGLEACTYIGYGDCTAYAQSYCQYRGGFQGACWGIRG